MSCEGQIMAALNDDTQEVTPLQMKLDVIANDIGKLGMYAAILIFHCLMCRQLIQGMQYDLFDLWGGEISPSLGTDCKYTPNSCSGMIGTYVQ